MNSVRRRISQLRKRARRIGYCREAVQLLQEAIDLAESAGDERLAFSLRGQLMPIASVTNDKDTLLGHFAARLAYADRNPDVDQRKLLWEMKSVVSGLAYLPAITREEIESALDDMQRRYRRYRASLHAVYFCRRTVALQLGDWAAARRAHRKLQKCVPDELSDCQACQLDDDIRYHVHLGDYDKAFFLADRLFTNPSLSCARVPAETFAYLLLPLIERGRWELAWRYHRQSLDAVRSLDYYSMAAVDHLLFLTLAGDLDEALRIFRAVNRLALDDPMKSDRINFYPAAWTLMQRLLERGDQQLPITFSRAELAIQDFSAKVSGGIEALAQWYITQAAALAEILDLRDGNSKYQQFVHSARDRLRLAQPLVRSRIDRSVPPGGHSC